MPNPAVAVLDIGSNSIKVLVARRAGTGELEVLLTRSLDARISAGISTAAPRLSEAGIARGLAAVRELQVAAQAFSPVATAIVATSAVRDAANGADFCAQVNAVSGFPVRTLSGETEARIIGRGLTADVALAHLQNFYVFDLGGGSLECLAFQQRAIAQAVSLQLGCVRLTEKFVADTNAPFSGADEAAVARHVAGELAAAQFRFDLPERIAVATGGTVATMRAMIGAATGLRAEATPARVSFAQARTLLEKVAPLTLAARRQVPGLPPARADVFPTALATLLAVAEAGKFSEFHHSFHNLRYGLAAELLSQFDT
ncbi:MAG: phosphatase [Candidatus Didemnitutus sp.]|nr:phosphatase [Candidatus Didemnitutus sp.]